MIARLCLPGFVFLIALGSAATSQTAPPSPSQPPSTHGAEIANPEQRQSADQKQSPTHNAIVEGGSNQAPDNKNGPRNTGGGNDSEGIKHHDDTSWEALTAKATFWLAIVTLVLAGATLALSVATIGLYRQTRRLADEAVAQGEKTERQIIIAEKSTGAAITAAKAAVDSASFERAWVSSIGPSQVIKTNSVNPRGEVISEVLGVRVAWQNSGRSPALNLGILVEAVFVDALDNVPTFTSVTPDHLRNSTLGPGVGSSSDYIWIFGDNLNEFRAGRRHLMIYSRVDYSIVSDISGNYMTEVTLVVSADGQRKDPTSGGYLDNIRSASVGTQSRAT